MLAVSVENLSKLYRLGTIGSGTLRDDLHALWSRLRRQPADAGAAARGELLALDEVAFEIPEGEILGIIGRNGAGKSTLLKILSRVTAPTSGRVRLRGRVASLLEVGTGFHPELTGRENIYLNGAILGMTKPEIRANLDAIIDFSGVEAFIDTPVKRYSSGMYVRLAFAVAAHLQADILIVDEVLAVGDAAFQRKCLGSMHKAARSGRTVLFVSHNLGAVTSLCERCILLESGRLAQDGAPREVVAAYLGANASSPTDLSLAPPSPGSDAVATLRRVCVRRPGKDPSGVYFQDEPVEIAITYVLHRAVADFSVAVQLLSSDGTVVAHCTDDVSREQGPKRAGEYQASLKIVAGALSHGSYWVSVLSAEPFVRTHFMLPSALTFRIEQASAETSRYALETWPGFLGPAFFEWSQRFTPAEG